MYVVQNLFELLVVTSAVLASLILAIIVYYSNRRSSTNKSFLIFTLITAFWGLVNYLSYQLRDPLYILLSSRLVIFLAVYQSFSLFHLLYLFPDSTRKMPKKYYYTLLPVVIITSLITLSPYAMRKVTHLANAGEVSTISTGPGMLLFGLVAVGFVVVGIRTLIKKYFKASTIIRRQYGLILIGIVLTFTLIIIFNFLLPVVFGIVKFVSYGALFIFPFIVCSSYAIIKHHLFNVKVIATEALVVVIWIILFSKIFVEQTTTGLAIDILIFGTTVPFGIFLIRSVIAEVRHREELEILTNKLKITADNLSASNLKLEAANSKLKELDNAKSEFMSIASHQLRTPLAGIMGYLSMITDGDFGAVNKEQQPVIKDVLEATKRLIRMVNIFLNVTRIEAGRFVMNFTTVSFHNVLEAIYKELKPFADSKKVDLAYTKKKLPNVEIDSDKIKDVVLNLVDNAIKYSPQGTVALNAEAKKHSIHVWVKDTGVGIKKGEVEGLFEKFVRGSGIAHVEPNGSGLGLFIAKKIVEAHGGRIWAESVGEGKGSTFHFEIPITADPKAKKAAEEFKQRAQKKGESTVQSPAKVETPETKQPTDDEDQANTQGESSTVKVNTRAGKKNTQKTQQTADKKK